MATVVASKATLTADQDPELNDKTHIESDPITVDIMSLPTEDIEDVEPPSIEVSRTTLHIYFENGLCHKLVTPTVSPSQERRFGPTPKQQKERRIAKRLAKKARLIPAIEEDALTPLTVSDSDKETFFLHTPYLSFHLPPSILFVGSTKYAPARPVALVHTGCFWRTYKIQLGPSLSLPGVIDPRGVVSWRHNGGSAKHLEEDERSNGGRALKGYKVRGWRLWGETGKAYVHGIRDKRRAGEVFDDPDVVVEGENEEGMVEEKVRADEVVHLRWHNPLSKQTRTYVFEFRGIEFHWKGTGTVRESKKCGWMLRFCHLKLVARVPLGDVEKTGQMDEMSEVCLGKYTSSIAAEKSGTLEVFDEAVLGFVEEYIPSLLGEKDSTEGEESVAGEEEDRIKTLKNGMFYQLIVATVICMANAEKEKRHTLIDLVVGILENAGNGGG